MTTFYRPFAMSKTQDKNFRAINGLVKKKVYMYTIHLNMVFYNLTMLLYIVVCVLPIVFKVSREVYMSCFPS